LSLPRQQNYIATRDSVITHQHPGSVGFTGQPFMQMWPFGMVMEGSESGYFGASKAIIDLKGPAVSIHTACSTSLVAVAHAFYALRTHQCDLALAGAAAVTCPLRSGYLYQEGGMLSPDGHTRPFDEQANGTVFSDGAAVVVLRRLTDALAAGDSIYAVIRGVATNNDGGQRMSFSAPSVEGQAEVIASALSVAGFHPETISFIEAHGTATPLGDPIEVEGLKYVSRAGVRSPHIVIGRTHDGRVAGNRHGRPETVPGRSLRTRVLCPPNPSVAKLKSIGRAGVRSPLVVIGRAHDGRVPGNRHRSPVPEYRHRR